MVLHQYSITGQSKISSSTNIYAGETTIEVSDNERLNREYVSSIKGSQDKPFN